MPQETSFTVNNIKFHFVNEKDGTETISTDGMTLSSKKSLFLSNHKFMHNGSNYEIRPKVGMTGIYFLVKVDGIKIKPENDENKPSGHVLLMCCWPLVLIFIGGAIGGALGGVAAGVNFALHRSSLPLSLKVLLNLASGTGAIIIWLVLASLMGHTPSQNN